MRRVLRVCLAGSTCLAVANGVPVRGEPPAPSRPPASAAEAWAQTLGPLDRPVPVARLVAGLESAAAAPVAARPLQFRELGPRSTISAIDPYYQGLGPVAGRVSSIAPVPGRPQEAFLGAASGGVWRTQDGGRRWVPVGDGLPALTVGAVAVDPRHPTWVWVGTGESNSWVTSVGLGVFRSTDSGRTWRAASGRAPFADCATSDLVVTGDAVLVAVLQGYGARVEGCAAEGAWRTSDGGRTWSRVLAGQVHDLVVDTRSPRRVYASGGQGSGLRRSDDGGLTWTSLSGLGLPPADVVSRSVLDLAPDDPRRLYLLVAAESSDLVGVFTSADAGATWQRLPATRQPCNVSQSYTAPWSGQCLYDIALLAERGGSALVGGVTLQRWTLDGAVETLGFGSRGIHVDQHALARDSAGRVWVGNDGGVYRTSDGGRTFTNLNASLQITQHTHGLGILKGGGVLVGSQDNGTLMRSRGGAWHLVLGADGGPTVARPGSAHLLFGSYQNLGIRRSRDGGLSWSDATRGIIPGEPRDFYAPLVGDPVALPVLYAATNRVYRTTDEGELWLPASPVLGPFVTALAVGRRDTTAVYAAVTGGVVWASHDGATWAPSTTVLPGRVSSLVVDARNPRRLWATVGGTGHGHLFSSTDGGLTFADGGQGLPDLPAYTSLFDARTGRLLVGTYGGLFSREPSRWVRERGLPAVPVTDLRLSPERRLVVATYGRGVFAAPLD